MNLNLKIISAGAGSGKTYRLTEEMVELLKGNVRASGIIATTFTKKAAAELQERVRVKLLEEGLSQEADDLTNALIGTVHGLGVKLLKRFAFEAGVSPEVDIIADEDQQLMFNQALATVLTTERIHLMEHYSNRLGLNKKERYDWRREVKQLTDVARANDFAITLLEESKIKSFESFKKFLGETSKRSIEDFNQGLLQLLETTLQQLAINEDTTKTTEKAASTLKLIRNQLKLKGHLEWHQWVKIAKIKVGAKSRDDVKDLIEFAWSHEKHPDFQNDIQQFIYQIFDIAIAALKEYDEYKKRRGLIDYIDMEIQVKRLLDHPQVKAVLKEELDLLMVDEFQDTNPIQLEIFLKLARLAKHSVWVGDPKQSIYGFRGADPKLMQEIIRQAGGVKPEDIQRYSWRSREDIVYATNALFTKAFNQLPEEQVALEAKRTKLATKESKNQKDEPLAMGDALIHYHYVYDGTGRKVTSKMWMNNCIAHSIKEILESKTYILPKDEADYRPALAGDVAILCRSNKECQDMAEALYKVGIKAAISRSGLLNTAEIKLILACLKLIMNDADSLSVAELLLLADDQKIEDIIDDRLEFLESVEHHFEELAWAKTNPFIQRIIDLRLKVTELSSTEILNLVLSDLDLRRIIAAWGNGQQRMDNVDVLRKLALQYEEACNRLHIAASLGGFLLYLNDLEGKQSDMQGSGESADAVNVLTYHRSKGLEWPLVVCHSLENNLKDNVWGISIMVESEEVDLDNLLANRWLRYWINPYSDQSKNTPLQERIDQSEIKKTVHQQALQEEARLLYVGITRARDYLILPTREKPTSWLNRVWHKGQGDIPTLDAHTPESPWEWKGKFLNKQTETRAFPKDFPTGDLPAETIFYFAEHLGKDSFIPAEIDLRVEGFSHEVKGKTGTALQYSPPMPTTDKADLYQVAKVVKAFMTADYLDYDTKERWQMAAQFLSRYELEEMMQVKQLVNQSASYYQFLEKTFPSQKVYRKYPIHYLKDGRVFNTIIDLIIATDKRLVLIQNSGFDGDHKKWRNKTLELTDWMHLSKSALLSIFPQKEIDCYVHFVLGGGLVELKTDSLGTATLDRISKVGKLD